VVRRPSKKFSKFQKKNIELDTLVYGGSGGEDAEKVLEKS